MPDTKRLSLQEKLLEAQRRIGAIKKDSDNPYFKSKYFDINGLLAEIKPVLNELGLVVHQPLGIHDGKSLLETRIIDVESGDVINSKVMLPDIPDPQKMGSAITYYRRYSLQSLLALEAEDDDANFASGKVERMPARKQKELVAEDDPHGIPF